jgi:hypothetical protein
VLERHQFGGAPQSGMAEQIGGPAALVGPGLPARPEVPGDVVDAGDRDAEMSARPSAVRLAEGPRRPYMASRISWKAMLPMTWLGTAGW